MAIIALIPLLYGKLIRMIHSMPVMIVGAGLFGNNRKQDGFEILTPKCGVIRTIFY